MDDIPGDERAAGRRYECEGGERRQLERRWDERQHDDARREPARPDPSWSLSRRAADEVDQAHTQADVREEIERKATAERHGGHRGHPPAMDIAEAIPRATMVVIEGVGHLPWLERPEEVRRRLRGFLRRVAHST